LHKITLKPSASKTEKGKSCFDYFFILSSRSCRVCNHC